ATALPLLPRIPYGLLGAETRAARSTCSPGSPQHSRRTDVYAGEGSGGRRAVGERVRADPGLPRAHATTGGRIPGWVRTHERSLRLQHAAARGRCRGCLRECAPLVRHARRGARPEILNAWASTLRRMRPRAYW